MSSQVYKKKTLARVADAQRSDELIHYEFLGPFWNLPRYGHAAALTPVIIQWSLIEVAASVTMCNLVGCVYKRLREGQCM